MEIIKNLQITDTAYGGAGVGRSQDGQVIFVQKTVEGDICDAGIYEHKNKYSYAKVINIIKPSENRIKPVCIYADICGGCSFAHINSETQHNIKKRIVLNQFRKYKYGIPKINVIKSDACGYRLRATARSKNGKIGFYEYGSNRLIEVDKCRVIKESLYDKMKEFAFINNLTGSIYAIENDECLSLADIKADNISNKDMYKLKSDSMFNGFSINNKKYGLSSINFNTFYGAVPVSYNSFFQANRYLLNEFQKKAVSLVSSGLDVIELYAGAGFFTCAIMKKNNVIACEYDATSSNLGRQLGYHIITSDSATFLSKIKKCDSLFLDPPREGADKKVIENWITKIDNILDLQVKIILL